MRSLFFACAALALCAAPAQAAQSWIFKPSYYSHHPVTNVRIGTQYSTGPVFTRPRGVYVSSSYRNSRSQIIVGNQSFDNSTLYEGWIQTGEQY